MTDWGVPVAFGVAASLATLLGGWIALRFADRIAALLAVAAGIVLGVALFDLLPESVAQGAGRWPGVAIAGWAVAGFAGYLALNRLLARADRRAGWRVHLGPASLTLHSLLDGVVMGLAFQVSREIGWVVALAVLTHDLADGLNTVSLALEARRREVARRWLVVNGCAPLAGVVLGLSIALPGATLGPVMAAFAGVFVYIGAVELVPRSLSRDGRARTMWLIAAGALTMLGVAQVAH